MWLRGKGTVPTKEVNAHKGNKGKRKRDCVVSQMESVWLEHGPHF